MRFPCEDCHAAIGRKIDYAKQSLNLYIKTGSCGKS
jgi:hypothetical protein